MSKKERVNALESVRKIVGCFLKNGALTPAYAGVNIENSAPSGVKYAAYSTVAKRYFVCTQSSISFSEDGRKFTEYGGYDFSSPFLVEDYIGGKATAAVISGTTATVYLDGEMFFETMQENLKCGVLHCGRIFGANGLKLCWSGTNGVNDWGAGIGRSGNLKLDPKRGEVLDMIVFGGKIVAVREYGLTVLSMYGSPENFSVDITDTDCDKVCKSTSRIIGGKLYFYSATGLKCFDGSKISRIECGRAVSDAHGAADYEGRYFLACRSEELNREVILCVEVDSGESCIIDERADALFTAEGVHFFNGGGHKKLERGGEFSFESGDIDFGTDRYKTVVKIEVSGKADLRISNEKYTRFFGGVSGTVKPHMRGKNFKIQAAGSGEVQGIFITAEVTDAV